MSTEPAGVRVETRSAQASVAVHLSQPLSELDLGELYAEWLPRVAQAAVAVGTPPAGPPYGRYHRWGPDIAELEIGFPVASPVAGSPAFSSLAPGEIGASELPGGRCAVLLHVGPYDGIGAAMQSLRAWVEQEGKASTGGPWESYLDDPAAVAADELRTELVWPFGDA